MLLHISKPPSKRATATPLNLQLTNGQQHSSSDLISATHLLIFYTFPFLDLGKAVSVVNNLLNVVALRLWILLRGGCLLRQIWKVTVLDSSLHSFQRPAFRNLWGTWMKDWRSSWETKVCFYVAHWYSSCLFCLEMYFNHFKSTFLYVFLF